VLSIALCFAVSPEMGLACACAMIGCFTALGLKGNCRDLFAVPLVVAGVGAALLLASRAGLLAGMMTFASGAYAQPFLPGPAGLWYVSLVIATAAIAGRRYRTQDATSAALDSGLLALGLALVPAALGRSDFGHLFWNGLALTLLLGRQLGRTWPRTARSWATGTGVLFLALAVAFSSVYVLPWLLRTGVRSGAISEKAYVLVAGLAGRPSARAMTSYRRLVADRISASDRARILALPTVTLPFATNDLLSLECAEKGTYRPSYNSYGITHVFTSAQLALQYESLSGHSTLLVPTEQWVAGRAGGVAESAAPSRVADPLYYFLTLGLPFSPTMKYQRLDPQRAVESWVAQHFSRVATIGPYAVLRRKP
jgi:hypothetical protein